MNDRVTWPKTTGMVYFCSTGRSFASERFGEGEPVEVSSS